MIKKKIERVFTLLPILLLLLPSVVAFGQSDSAGKVVLDLVATPENPRNSEGDFLRLNDGRILFAYTRFMQSSSDHAPAQIMGRFSSDEGKTWTKEDQLIVNSEGDQNVMSVSFLRLKNGHICMFYARKNSLEDNIPQLRISKDETKTWSAPQAVITDQKGYFVLNNDRVIQLKSGRILVPVSLHKTPNSAWNNRGEIRCYFSDDDGLTWNRGQVLPAPDEIITQEPGVVELHDGRVMMIIRASGGAQYKSYSDDQGQSWSLAEKTNIPSPIAPASLERLLSTGDLILVWNNNGKSGPGYFKAKRSPLTMAISQDEGKSWSYIQNLENNEQASYAYTAIEQVGDYILLAYYLKPDDKPGYDLRIKRVAIKEAYSNKPD